MNKLIQITEPYYATVLVTKAEGSVPEIESVTELAVMFEGAKLDIRESVLSNLKTYQRFAQRVMREYEAKEQTAPR